MNDLKRIGFQSLNFKDKFLKSSYENFCVPLTHRNLTMRLFSGGIKTSSSKKKNGEIDILVSGELL